MKRSLLTLVCLLTLVGCQNAKPNQTKNTQATPPSTAAGKFTNVSDASGLTAFTHTDGSSGRKYFIEQMGSGVALLDYDGDGFLDVYFCSGAALPGYKGEKPHNRLFHNNHDGTFTDVTEKAGVGATDHYSVGVAVADYDNDGKPDLYICGYMSNILFHNEGNGTFKDVTKQAGVVGGRLCSSAAWGDYDGDGKLDLYVCRYVKYDLAEDLNCSKFAGHKSYCGPNLYEPEQHILYHNNGNGTFTDVTEKSGIAKAKGNGLGVVWIDYDDDNHPDIFVADDQSPNLLWHNNGNGTFTEVAMDMGVAFGEQGHAQAGMGVDVGDFDNDGKLDILVTNFSEEANALYHNQNKTFRDIAYSAGFGAKTLMYLGFGTGFIDYDCDGWQDLFFANGHVLDDIEMYSDSVTWKQANLLFRNRGDRTFEDTSAPTGISDGKRVSRGVTFGDLFNRGRTDIIINVLRDKPLVLRNDCAPQAHWLQLDLHAKWGNPQAIGAKIWLKAGGTTQRHDVKTCGSYASSLDPRPLFGLGKNTSVEELKIQWPSGKITVLNSVAIDQMLKVEEPEK
jgi:hypothetical protein